MADFIWYAILAGISLAIVAGPLGSFVVWRRMSYFGDTLAHSALLGIALGILFNINIQATILAVCVLLALALVSLERRNNIAIDTLLGILAHSTLATGCCAARHYQALCRVNLESYLFGELLTISTFDLWVIILFMPCCPDGSGVFLERLSFYHSARRAGFYRRRRSAENALFNGGFNGGGYCRFDENSRRSSDYIAIDHSSRNSPTDSQRARKHGRSRKSGGLPGGVGRSGSRVLLLISRLDLQ